MNGTEIERDLRGFTGTESYHKVSPLHGRLVLTDGALYLAKEAQCFWLFDIIASYQPICLKDKEEMCQYMQFWRINVNADKSADVICDRDKGNEMLRQSLEYTDFPMQECKLFVCRQETPDGYRMVAMVPSEY